MNHARTPQEVYAAARAQLTAMDQALSAEPIDLMGLAKHYAALSIAMVDVARAAGQTSVRFEAVRRALDLRTPKSALQRFLDEP